jgi:hypothetical protein
MAWTDKIKKKPKLVIFEDNSVQLERFVQEFDARGYEVVGILVETPDVKAQYCDANNIIDQQKVSDDADSPWSIECARYSGFKRMVSNQFDVVKALMDEAPDVLLTDYALVTAEDFDEGHTILDIAAMIAPTIPKVMHSTAYTRGVSVAEQAECNKAGYSKAAKGDYDVVDRAFKKGLASHLPE